ncbi:Crinkler effector protein 8 [Phytophthora ramorum]|uniref:Crinkler effector protein 8 n=1 Tax=Phytophthora ramorum TaxID=164328 RepID=UPI003096E63F|nr:Crinkler effector protein 8 [Phytophthora ramorum]
MKDEEKKCEWVESGSEDVKKLKKGEVTSAITRLATEINKLHEEFSLENKLRKMQPPVAEQIYVLVRVPSGKKSLEWLNGLPTSLLVSKRRNLE